LTAELLSHAYKSKKTKLNPIFFLGVSHVLQDLGQKVHRRCTECYKMLSKEMGRAFAQARCPKTRFQCTGCVRSYCPPCFVKCHWNLLLF